MDLMTQQHTEAKIYNMSQKINECSYFRSLLTTFSKGDKRIWARDGKSVSKIVNPIKPGKKFESSEKVTGEYVVVYCLLSWQ